MAATPSPWLNKGVGGLLQIMQNVFAFTTTTTTTEGPNMLPFIIGGVVGAIALLAIGIGLYFYCRKKKKMGGQKKTQGLNTSGTTVNTGTGTGTGATGGTAGAPVTGLNNGAVVDTQARY